MTPKLGVLHHPDSQTVRDLHQGIGDSIEIVWIVVDGEDGGRVQRLFMERLGLVADIGTTDLDAAAATLARVGIDGIVTFIDLLVPVAAELANRLRLPYHTTNVARALTDKFVQRQRLAAAGVPQPRFWQLPAGLRSSALDQIADSISFPAVLKPTHGAASRGVAQVRSTAELSATYRPEIEQLVEEYMPDTVDHDQRFGSYVSVESAVSGSDVSHLAISGRFLLSEAFRENGIFIPAALDDTTTSQVLELATAAIRALDVRDACLHIEIKLTPDGPKIIEVNGRVGGGPPAVLRSVSDVSLFRVAAEIALGHPVRFDTLVPCNGIGYWSEVNPPLHATRVLNVSGTTELAESPNVNTVNVRCPPGTELDPNRGTFGVVTVRGRTDTIDDLAETVELINDTLKIEYEAEAPNDPTGDRANVPLVQERGSEVHER